MGSGLDGNETADEDNLKAQWTDRDTAVNTWRGMETNREGKRNGYGTVQRTGSQSAAVLEQVRDGQYLLVLVLGFTFIL